MQYNRRMQNIYQAKGSTLEEQYFDAGHLFGESIRNSVKKIAKRRSEKARIRRQVSEKSLVHLRNNAVCHEFLSCLDSWSRGAGITSAQAMWLLCDNLSGCQTFIGRYKTGVALLHTEEDFENIKAHMTGSHSLSFSYHGELSRCLVYNDLFPGSGLYGWKKNMIVAVDSLFLREDGIEDVSDPLLANMISWLIWRMKPEEAAPEKIFELINSLGELIDGYAINVVRKVGEKVEGYKLTLARSEMNVEYLGEENGSYLRQVNVVDPKYPKVQWAIPPKRLWRGGWKYFRDRLKAMDLHAKEYVKVGNFDLSTEHLEIVHQILQETIFGKLRAAYINSDVGAVCAGLVDLNSTSVSTKLNDDKSISELEYIDQFSN